MYLDFSQPNFIDAKCTCHLCNSRLQCEKLKPILHSNQMLYSVIMLVSPCPPSAFIPSDVFPLVKVPDPGLLVALTTITHICTDPSHKKKTIFVSLLAVPGTSSFPYPPLYIPDPPHASNSVSTLKLASTVGRFCLIPAVA